MTTPERKRARKERPPTRDELQRRLLTWRGYVMVAVGGAGLSSFSVAYYSQQGDALTAILFLATLFFLIIVGIVALARVRRVKAEIARVHRAPADREKT